MTDLIPAQAAHGDPVPRLVAAFLDGRRSTGTRDVYRRDLTHWTGWCADHGIRPLEAWPADVQRWLADLRAAGESGTSQARRLAAVSSWYSWLIRHQAAPRNPARLEKDERPVRAPRPAPALSDGQAGDLIAAANDDSPRAAAIVTLLLLTGIRVGELVAARVADVGFDRGHPVLHVRGKGGKTRPVVLVPAAYARLDTYLRGRGDVGRAELVPAEQAGAGPDPVPLIATATGRPIDRKEVRRLLKRLGKRAGLPDALVERLSPHSTRATYATTALDDGVPVRDVQYAMGHASPLTTEGYDRSQLSPDRAPGYRLMRRFTPRRSDDGNHPQPG